jgi:hypothetical protein
MNIECPRLSNPNTFFTMDSAAKRADVVDQMVAITAADGEIGRTSCEELLRASDWNIEVPVRLSCSNRRC